MPEMSYSAYRPNISLNERSAITDIETRRLPFISINMATRRDRYYKPENNASPIEGLLQSFIISI